MADSRAFHNRLGRIDIRDYTVYLGFFAILFGFAVLLGDHGFLSTANLMNIGRITATITIMAVGAVFVLSSGEIDLSIGSVVGLSSVMSAIVLRDYGLVAGIAAGLCVGLVVGLVNGVLTTKVRIPSFLVTLGTMQIVAGLSRSVSNLQAVPVDSPAFETVFGGGSIGPIPSIYVWILAVVGLGHILYRKTPFGRHVLATGGNRVAAKASGIRVDQIKIEVLILSSLMASLAGVLDAGRFGGARYDFGSNDLLAVLAATVIGGTSLFGGRGTVFGALVGSLLIGVLNNGLILLNLSESDQMIGQGTIIIVAVSLSLRDAGDTMGSGGVGRLLRRWVGTPRQPVAPKDGSQ